MHAPTCYLLFEYQVPCLYIYGSSCNKSAAVIYFASLIALLLIVPLNSWMNSISLSFKDMKLTAGMPWWYISTEMSQIWTLSDANFWFNCLVLSCQSALYLWLIGSKANCVALCNVALSVFFACSNPIANSSANTSSVTFKRRSLDVYIFDRLGCCQDYIKWYFV